MAEFKKTKQELLAEIESTISNAASCSNNMDKWLSFLLGCKQYSINNMALLYGRYEHPFTKTFKQWQKVGAQVLKGEKACKLLAPYKFKGFWREKQFVDVKNATEAEKAGIEAGTIEVYDRIWFNEFNVFDVTQTSFADLSREELLLKFEQQSKEKKKSLDELVENTGMDRQELINIVHHAVKHRGKQYADRPRLRTIYEYALRFVVDDGLALEENLSKFDLGSIEKDEVKTIKTIMTQVLVDGEDIIDMMQSL